MSQPTPTISTISTISRRSRIPIFVLVGSLLLTVMATLYVWRVETERDELRFQARTNRVVGAIESRMEMYTALLRSTAAFFASSDTVSLGQFRAFMERTEVQARYPGIQGVGFTRRILPEELPYITRHFGETEYDDFHVWPDHERDEYHAIVYLEPQDFRNRVAIGYDMYTEQVRQAAMQRARDTGEPSMSGIVTLVQEIDGEIQPGFLMYLPLYRTTDTLLTAEMRRDLLRGFIYSPFRAHDLFQGIFQFEPVVDVRFNLYAGTEIDETELLHSSAGSSAEPQAPRYESVHELDLAGQPWTVSIATLPLFERGSGRKTVYWVFILGLIISALLFVVTFIQARASRAAQDSARQIAASERALRESEERYRQIVDTAHEGIWLFGEDGKTIYVNERMAEMVKATPSELANRRVDEFLDESSATRLRHRLHGLMLDDAANDFRMIRADGSEIWVALSTSRIAGEGAGTDRMLVMASDITERKHYESGLIAAKERAEELARLKSAFLANMSHEIRTPLTGIIGFAELLSEEISEEHKAFSESIGRSGERLLETLNSILDLANIEARADSYQKEAVSVAAVLEETRELMEPIAAKKGLDVAVHITESDVAVEVVPIHLRRVLNNLVGNAIKFTERGSVSLTADADDNYAHISVQDTGVGIDPGFLPRVFDEFMQESSGVGRSHEGTGLGLTITKRLVETMDGTIQVESTKGEGSIFTVMLPRLKGVSSAPSTRDGAWREVTEREFGILHETTVLVVEDNAESRMLFSRLLNEVCNATVVENIRAAERAMAHGTFDIILVDINLGSGPSGLDFVTQIKQVPRWSDVPAIALTAYALPGDRERFLRRGFNAYMSKPFSKTELLKLMVELLDKQETPE